MDRCRCALSSSLGSCYTEDIDRRSLARSSITSSYPRPCFMYHVRFRALEIEFLALEHRAIPVIEYHIRCPALERFVAGIFLTERATKFVRGLRFSLQSIMSVFHCATLE